MISCDEHGRSFITFGPGQTAQVRRLFCKCQNVFFHKAASSGSHTGYTNQKSLHSMRYLSYVLSQLYSPTGHSEKSSLTLFHETAFFFFGGGGGGGVVVVG